jgi:hypothetical protein
VLRTNVYAGTKRPFLRGFSNNKMYALPAGAAGVGALALAQPSEAKIVYTPVHHDYHYDQWLRLWLLGGPPTSRRIGGKHKGKFENKPQYRQLLLDVFDRSKRLLRRDGIVYVRTDRREITLNITLEVLREVLPDHQLRCKSRPYFRPTQTRLFGHVEPRVGEIDLILTP